MSKEFSFSVMPSVSISRSRFARKSQHKTAFKLGEIVPIYVDEVLPGSTKTFDMASLVRMSTPIAPIMDNIYLDLYAFFVPNRLVWDHWKEFMGENNTSAGIPAVSYSVPIMYDSDTTGGAIGLGSLLDYMGLPVGYLTNSDDELPISALPARSYYLIYNEWFRNQNVIAPIPVRTDDNAGVIIGETTDCVLPLCKASKLADYFTKALPYAQKGQPVTLPLGKSAPIKTKAEFEGKTGLDRYTGMLYAATSSGAMDNGDIPYFADSTGALSRSYDSAVTDNGSIKGWRAENFVADLSAATAVTINQLRYAFQLQKLLEKDALMGSRYFEILKAHFGVESPDARLQRPEYLGGQRIRINVDQVLSTAGYAASSSTTVGAPGANSVTADKCSLFTKSFVEHGHILVLAVARHDQTYNQGINRMWSRSGRYDFYWPVFANLGAQEVKNKEIFAVGNDNVNDDKVFAYQESWAEYRYKPSICSSIMRPGVTGALDFWTLSNNFASLPTLGQTFIEQGRANIQRALVTGSSGPDFIADFYFEDVSVLPMPTYSIPGLVDHH